MSGKKMILFLIILILMVLVIFAAVNYYRSNHQSWNISLEKDGTLSAEIKCVNKEIWLYIMGEGDMISMTEDSTFSQVGRAWRSKPYKIKKCFIYDGCTSIGHKAFSNCQELNYIYLPNSIKKIGCFAFEQCINLEIIEFQGSTEMWQKIRLDSSWRENSKISLVKCSDGVINLE